MARLEYVLKTEILSSALPNSLDFVSYFFLLFFPFLVNCFDSCIVKKKSPKRSRQTKEQGSSYKEQRANTPNRPFFLFSWLH